MHRRQTLAAVGSILAGSTASCFGARQGDTEPQTEGSQPASQTPETWPQLACDARNTRNVAAARGPRDDAAIAWSGLGDRPVYPPVVDDQLYFTEAWTDGAALALSTDDGTARWSTTDLPPMRWAPAIHDGRLLLITRTTENVVRLHALDTTTGDELWRQEKGITASSGSRPPTGPTVRDGSIYIGSDRGIVACDVTSGAVEWTATLQPHVIETEDGPVWRTDWAAPAVTDDRAFTFDMNDSHWPTRKVYAVDRANGEREWTAELATGEGWYLTGHVVAGEDNVFVSALKPHISFGQRDRDWAGAERLYALDAESGNVAWDWDLSGKTVGPPAYADGTLYVAEWLPDADSGRLHAMDAAEGSSVWTYKTDVGGLQSPTVATDTVYITQGNELAAVARGDGSQRWRLPLEGRFVGPPVVVGDTAYVLANPGRDSDSRLLAIRES